jgi:hypothetical protein
MINEQDWEEGYDETISPIQREDKIFNNRYHTGELLKDTDEYEFSRKISVSSDYSDNYLKDVYDYEENLENKFILDIIFDFLKNDDILSKLLFISTENQPRLKAKFSKEEVNLIFNRVHDNLDMSSHSVSFYSPIFILEAISSFSGFDYKKIFDSLETEIQEMLIIELNKKYKFLEGKMHRNKIH